MSFNMRDYVSDDHVESIGEIAKSQSAIIQALSLENSKLEEQLQQKENIIKEVREKLNTQLAFTSSYQLNYQSAMSIIEEAKQILDKGE